ncbi:MAG: hypothetical protein LKJ86_07225 [Oscillibacter sp.]|jgi:hypothetical protein|nr:hypothetical protein [Oscillibacter sp.]
MKMNLKPVFRYEMRDYLMGSWPFFAVIVAIVIASFAGAFLFNGGEVSFMGYGMAACICLFVFGVVEPRPALRLCAQMGVSRRTAFVGNLISAVADCAILALAGEILFTIAKVFAGSRMAFSDIYQLFYQNEHLMEQLSIGGHVLSILLNTACMLAAYCLGMFFTFLFWRLSKVWCVVAAVAIPLTLNIVPAAVYRCVPLARAARAFIDLLASSAWNLMGFLVIVAAVFAVISYLLVRKANIKAPTSK